MKPPVGVIVLAAGESSRLGKPKQLLQFRGKTLIRHISDIALESGLRPVVVVLGANSEAVKNEIDPGVIRIVNSEWNSGMASSIRAGIRAIDESVEAIILMLCDQPLITSEILKQLAQHGRSGLAAAEYNGTLGVPALFGREYFAQLLRLEGHEGAKKILLSNIAKVARVPCPEAALDIDTAGDYERLRRIE